MDLSFLPPDLPLFEKALIYVLLVSELLKRGKYNPISAKKLGSLPVKSSAQRCF